MAPPIGAMSQEEINEVLADPSDPYGPLGKYRYATDKLHEGKLEAMLMENLYHIRYSGEGLEPNPSVQAEHKKQIKRNTGKDI